MELGPFFWNMVHFLDAEHLVYKFPHTNPVLQTHHMVVQYTSLLLHWVSFSYLLILIFFFFVDDDGTRGMGFGGSFVREEKQFPSYLCI